MTKSYHPKWHQLSKKKWSGMLHFFYLVRLCGLGVGVGVFAVGFVFVLLFVGEDVAEEAADEEDRVEECSISEISTQRLRYIFSSGEAKDRSIYPKSRERD